MSARCEAKWPPAPHDPRGRSVLGRHREWELRMFAPEDPARRILGPRGLLQLQLWHRASRVSVLLPSRLTGEQYDVFPIADVRCSFPSYDGMAAAIDRWHELAVPAEHVLRALRAWLHDGCPPSSPAFAFARSTRECDTLRGCEALRS